jgi:hypothetical protein
VRSTASRPAGQRRRIPFGQLMVLITFGGYAFWWIYKSFEEVRRFRGQGESALMGFLGIFLCISFFRLPRYVARMYHEEGKTSPVGELTGFWMLVPYIGIFLWMRKIQSALNHFWASQAVAALA